MNNLLNQTKFSISLSRTRYAQKPTTTQWAKVSYTMVETTASEFLEYMAQGYCYTQLYNRETFSQTDKTKANWVGQQVITFDVDNVSGQYQMEDFVSTLSYKPSIAYTSANDHAPKSNEDKAHARFRLLYILDEIITNEDTVHGIYDKISSTFDTSFFEGRSDHCGRSIAQQFYGNGTSSMRGMMNDVVYSVSDFGDVSSIVSVPSKRRERKVTAQELSSAKVDRDYLKDLYRLSQTEFLDRYACTYELIFESKVSYNEWGYAKLGGDYVKIETPFKFDTAKGICVPMKFRDGQQRRRKLFLRGMMRKKIKPTICIEELIYNLVFDRYHYFDNDDGILTDGLIVEIAENVMNSDYDIDTTTKHKFKVDKQFCQDNDISPNQYKQMVRKMIGDDRIDKFYRSSVSVKDNLQRLKLLGKEVGKSKLYSYVKERGIPTKGDGTNKYNYSLDNLQTCIECSLFKGYYRDYI